tara:strand:- start:374 stop:667 length:294 start_codon:yes stop_codon:yes gene_type:complete
MVDFGIGMGLLIGLLIANIIVINLCKMFPKHILGIVPVMIGLDTVVTLGYTFTVKIFVDNLNYMVMGVGLSITLALLHKTMIMLKLFKSLFKHEIGN